MFMVRTPEVGSVGEGVMRALPACWMYTMLIWGAAAGPGAGAIMSPAQVQEQTLSWPCTVAKDVAWEVLALVCFDSCGHVSCSQAWLWHKDACC